MSMGSIKLRRGTSTESLGKVGRRKDGAWYNARNKTWPSLHRPDPHYIKERLGYRSLLYKTPGKITSMDNFLPWGWDIKGDRQRGPDCSLEQYGFTCFPFPDNKERRIACWQKHGETNFIWIACVIKILWLAVFSTKTFTGLTHLPQFENWKSIISRS